MSDPAIEAADRAEAKWTKSGPYRDLVADAARGALAPIRELHKPVGSRVAKADLCVECSVHWPCATAKLCYTSEELNR